ncbi:fasciclin domain-containing protein [Nocardioides sp. cx-169]|uniref:fasciclin domain-containing protein n=1 Tax=Nocardioides sp. cx-169 TaxID=2899080 RepID=UPI001E4D71AF|nr:fasciclin domain-containing protein [Nocardioides sp. cx-169]MCD4536062.1 fasciclin domain-containing protein [Nocardioides sp. cx-169]
MRKLNRVAAGLVAAVAAMATSSAMLVPAEAAPAAQGNRSLAKVLAADGTRFDRNWGDFDVTEAAVLAVLKAKPDSAVSLLTKGRQRATVFVPTDAAFRNLVHDLTGKRPHTEKAAFKAVAGLGIDTVETVLLYHVVPGATLNSQKVVAAAKADTRIQTAAGIGFKVDLRRGEVVIVDRDYNDNNARAIAELLDINAGNKQIAHGITKVLRPADL